MVPLQDLPQELTLKEAQSPACQPLVADMVMLLGRLKGLSHLEDAGEQQVGSGAVYRPEGWGSGCAAGAGAGVVGCRRRGQLLGRICWSCCLATGQQACC